jgi:copper chaperone CopZ
MVATPFQIVIGSIFLLLVVFYLVRKLVNYIKGVSANKKTKGELGREFIVGGMTCGNCAAGLEATFRNQELVDNAKIEFDKSKLTIWGSISDEKIKSVIEQNGYKVV